LLGEPASLPLAIAPTGLAGLFFPNGEIHGACAASEFGVPFCLSTMSICSIEDVSGATGKPFWQQIYLFRDREFNSEMITRARAANCSVLVLTVDLPVLALRRRDRINGLTVPPRLTWRNAIDILSKPRWVAGVLLGKRRTFGNLAGRVGTQRASTLAEWTASQFDRELTWHDVEWIRDRWPGKLVIKGIMNTEDAKLASSVGADAVVVSNHGGRQLDSAASTISLLPKIANTLDGRCEVLIDGGIQSGQDILKALALGARGCLIGRAFLYALAARGRTGVLAALTFLRDELEVAMVLTGQSDVRQIDSKAAALPSTIPRR
jgi:L-lactate dehydrogenase (cytochrome)